MTNYAKIENNQITEYPLSEYEIKSRFTNVSWIIGEFDPPEGYTSITEVPQPQYNSITENCVLGSPIFTTEWTQTWTVEPATAEEIAERTALLEQAIRTERNARLTASDWTQLPDVSLANKTDWATYRQSLRDITNQPGFPVTVTWPTEPS